MVKIKSVRAVHLALVATVTIVSGCIGRDPPQVARVVIEATPAAPLRLVVSTQFSTLIDPETERREPVLFLSDTIQITGAYEDEISIRSTGRIFVELSNPGTTPEGARLRVFFDGDLEYDGTRDVVDGSPIRYLYTSTFSS